MRAASTPIRTRPISEPSDEASDGASDNAVEGKTPDPSDPGASSGDAVEGETSDRAAESAPQSAVEDDDGDDYDFFPFPERIALRPAHPRHDAGLLLVPASRRRGLGDFRIRDLPDLLEPGDVPIVNDARVSAARLTGWRMRDDDPQARARIEATLLDRVDDDDIASPRIRGMRSGETEAETGAETQRWRVLARPARRLRPGDILRFDDAPEAEARLIERRDEGQAIVALPSSLAAACLAGRSGTTPLPPYIAARRDADAADRDDYQTMFARRDGSAAAPTAGLHFTPELLDALRRRGIDPPLSVTLHIGLGTFKPLRTADLEAGRLHPERCELDAAVADRLNAARRDGRRLLAVGTTTLRTLESAVDAEGRFHPFRGETDLFIRPGHCFRGADMLLTNFHLPKSSLLMMVAAFIGKARLKEAYRHAIAAGYRFYSYGDACLLEGVATQRPSP